MIRYFLDSTFGVDANGAYAYDLIRKGTVEKETSISYEISCGGKLRTVAKSITGVTFKEAEEILTSQYSNWGDKPYNRDTELSSRKNDWR